MTGWSSTSDAGSLDDTLAMLRACRICRDTPRKGATLPHEPRPIIQAGATARLCIASQAPGRRAHLSGIPFQDASGRRLRDWLGLDEATFYDPGRVAILPMGHCFPGNDASGGDLPPRSECAPAWREALLGQLPLLSLVLLIGRHAQAWHLGKSTAGKATPGALASRLDQASPAEPGKPRFVALPHPSWRNSGWLRLNPWFEAAFLPPLRAEIGALLSD